MKLRCLVVSILVAVAACSCVTLASEVSDLIAQAEASYDRWNGPFDHDAYESRLMMALGLWGQVLPMIPETEVQTRAFVLGRLSTGYREFRVYFDRETPQGRETRKSLAKLSADYALDRLRADPDFRTIEATDGLVVAIGAATDIEGIYNYGDYYGQWLNHDFAAALQGGVDQVAAAFERVIELDETYREGEAHYALGALIAQAFFLLGRDFHDAVPHYERAIELNPYNLWAMISYAEDYAARAWNIPLRIEILELALERAQDPECPPDDPLYQSDMVARIQELLDALT